MIRVHSRRHAGTGPVTGPISLAAAPSNDWLRRHAAALGAWLAGHAWNHFITLTTEFPIGEPRLVGEFDRFVRRLERRGAPIAYFYAIERNRTAAGWPHLHALIAGTTDMSLDGLRRRWFLGVSHAAVYDPVRDAAFYVTKGLLIDEDSYDFSRRKPPLRNDLDPVEWLAHLAERAVGQVESHEHR